MRKLTIVVFLPMMLPSCAATSPPERVASLIKPLETALLSEPGALLVSASNGEAQAQYAFSIVLEQGLHGRAANPVEATIWRQRALSQRGVTPITQYVPAVNGQSSRVHIINLPRYEVTRSQQALIRRCMAALAARYMKLDRVAAASNSTPCGDASVFRRLEPLWAAAQE